MELGHSVSLMTVTSLVMQNRRGQASRPLRLPIIAPKEEIIGKPEKSLVAPPRIRLPPRSRTGCWYVSTPALGKSTAANQFPGHVG